MDKAISHQSSDVIMNDLRNHIRKESPVANCQAVKTAIITFLEKEKQCTNVEVNHREFKDGASFYVRFNAENGITDNVTIRRSMPVRSFS